MSEVGVRLPMFDVPMEFRNSNEHKASGLLLSITPEERNNRVLNGFVHVVRAPFFCGVLIRKKIIHATNANANTGHSIRRIYRPNKT